ncbi:DUF2283 domain-containing protein [Candidatus Desantisbacteria bacterium CG07_land_8_20_14_0_80_39_15]|uniref:DUF2283 domain-containing protein n=1 Tax=Candidatus Desantisbacteria bacterium CG07_land_8_20_14_0_80_39_15 TaxID=1974549 RepID=A0A2M6ZEI0_9BACT|nr:MAG: DUF2283 domain-containing protein [Candidatus Desantisbacteria bacterium CG07_land_8_20_14_0_80_39_15]
MRINYDPETDILYVRFREDKIEESDEIKEGIIIDYDVKGRAVGIEFLDALEMLAGKPELMVEFPLPRKDKVQLLEA